MNDNKFKEFFSAASYACSTLMVLIVCKAKIITGNEALRALSAVKLQDQIFFGLPMTFNPIYYYDDLALSIGVFIFLTVAFSFRNNTANLIAIILCYLISIYSIIGQIFLYKYGAPFTPELFYHIGGVFELRTSIEYEIGENYRLIIAFMLLFIIMVLMPKAMMLIIVRFGGYGVHKSVSNSALYFSLTICVVFVIGLRVLGIKNYPELQCLVSNPPINLIGWYYNEITTSSSESCENYIFKDQVDIIDNVGGFSKLDFEKRKRNVILIILETTIGNYFDPGSNRKLYLPNISKMAKNSIQLLKCYSPGAKSTKAFFSILTGFYPLLNYRFYVRLYPDSKIPDLFTKMKGDNYKTFIGYSGDLKYDNMKSFIADRDVDKIVDIADSQGQYETNSWCVDDKIIYDNFFKWVDGISSDARFFATFITMNTHHPFWTPKHYDDKISMDIGLSKYEKAMHYQDFLLGQLVDYLERRNIIDNTVIIITGDHGGLYQLTNNKVKNSYRNQFDMIHRVPLFLYSKQLLSGPIVNDRLPVVHADILPTILDMSGIGCERYYEGRSIFDDKIKSRIIFLVEDFYKKNLTAISGGCFLRFTTDKMGVKLAKSMGGKAICYMGDNDLYENMKAKADQFVKHHDCNIIKYRKIKIVE